MLAQFIIGWVISALLHNALDPGFSTIPPDQAIAGKFMQAGGFLLVLIIAIILLRSTALSLGKTTIPQQD